MHTVYIVQIPWPRALLEQCTEVVEREMFVWKYEEQAYRPLCGVFLGGDSTMSKIQTVKTVPIQDIGVRYASD